MNIAVLDLETDPFEFGVLVKPFLSGFYDGRRVISFWSDDCIKQLVEALNDEQDKWTIYAHNGGRFDFFYFMDYLSKGDMRIINGRIVQARMGIHELRDSFAIMPFPLADYAKDIIDYQKFERGRREQHRDEIMKYFRSDLVNLYELVTAFVAEFGTKLTIGSASMKELRKRQPFEKGNAEYDAKFRKDFYFGGRNQVFKSGIINGDIRVYDLNSAYPDAMCNQLHPIGVTHDVATTVKDNTVFVVAEGKNHGAFPTRLPNNSLDFNVPYGRFSVTIHEWEVALATKTFEPDRIIRTFGWDERATFEEFVTHFYEARKLAKEKKDKIHTIFYKFVLNSAYGKFAQNPDNYFDWYITAYGDTPPSWHECGKGCVEPCEKRWSMAYIHDVSYTIWKRPIVQKFWYNIATGASITGAVRATLLRGLSVTEEPLYCDTDSIICRGSASLEVHATRLGAWDLEARGSMVAIAGKKLYAILDENGDLVKKAHKGARLSHGEIVRIAQYETITADNPVPSFKWDGSHSFVSRKIKRTA